MVSNSGFWGFTHHVQVGLNVNKHMLHTSGFATVFINLSLQNINMYLWSYRLISIKIRVKSISIKFQCIGFSSTVKCIAHTKCQLLLHGTWALFILRMTNNS